MDQRHGNTQPLGKKLHNCRKRNHFATSGKGKRKLVQEVQEQDDVQGEINEISPSSTSREKDAWYQKVIINETNIIHFKLDTGSQVNLISYNIFRTLKFNNKINKRSTQTRLKPSGGSQLLPLFMIKLPITLNNEYAELDFYVTKE